MTAIRGEKIKSAYFENLDFLRFILAIEVLIYHIPEISRTFGLPSFKGFVFQQKGSLSVFWFFVLSGFLLSWLARTDTANHKFSIKKFFIRRVLRIWPVYYLVTTIGIALYYFILPYLHIPFQNNASLSTAAFLSYFFLSNVLQRLYDPGGILIVTWSVSVEEQFYLFFPFWVKLFFSNKKLRVILATLLLVAVVLFDTVWPYPIGFLERYEIYVEFFIIGMLASELLPFFAETSEKIKTGFFFIAVIVLLLSFSTTALELFHVVYARLVFGITAAFVILVFSTSHIKISHPLIRLGGRISYGIYMYHMIVITGLVFFMKTFLNDFAQKNPNQAIILLNILSILGTYLAAYVSYITFEKYFLAKKPY